MAQNQVVEMNEMGLLDYNYEVEDTSGQIDDNTNNQIKKTKDTKKEPMISPKEKTNIMQMNNNNNNNNNNNTNPPSKMTQCHLYCTQIFYWIPIRSLCFFGAVALFILPFLDDKFGSPTVIEWFLGWYIQAFAILSMFIESPTWWLTKKIQLWVFFYARFLRRTSGRAGFYITLSILTFAGIHDKATITMFAGIYMIIISFVMLLFSRLAAKQLHTMYNYMLDGDYNMLDKELINTLNNYYNQIDTDRSKKNWSNTIICIC
eukprot:844677_1